VKPTIADKEPGAAIEGILMVRVFWLVAGVTILSSSGIGQSRSWSDRLPGRVEIPSEPRLKFQRPTAYRDRPKSDSTVSSTPITSYLSQALSILHPPFIRAVSSKAIEERETQEMPTQKDPHGSVRHRRLIFFPLARKFAKTCLISSNSHHFFVVRRWYVSWGVDDLPELITGSESGMNPSRMLGAVYE
jgi:hypothetical protein